jgi:20S proteasome subunit beta 5
LESNILNPPLPPRFDSNDNEFLKNRELQYHGTTTLAFKYKDSVIVCVDSKATIGNYIGSTSVKKIIPVTDTIVATMAGGAADCSYWIRLASAQARYQLAVNNIEITVIGIAKTLVSRIKAAGGDLSIGTMIAGYDKIDGPQRKLIHTLLYTNRNKTKAFLFYL